MNNGIARFTLRKVVKKCKVETSSPEIPCIFSYVYDTITVVVLSVYIRYERIDILWRLKTFLKTDLKEKH